MSYTVIRAPDDGVVARVEQLQVGDYINAAAPVFGLVSSRDVWVEANFKEDDLTYMRAGQAAEIRIDAYPGRRFKAQVASLSPGTGAQFSLLPPEDATGNWVKVVQRVPVRLQLDAAEFGDSTPLHAGLSAEVTVDTGHHRSLSATQDQMSWVLTSYIVAAAIVTPLTGWLADRFGRKPLFLASIIGFTCASALCGMAQSLEQIVLFRVLQGLCGAALIPMSQAVLFDAYPPAQHGRAMAIWGVGVVMGPMLGPMLGGWLTDDYSWRWVFYINVPFGILAVLGVMAHFLDTTHARKSFDFFGFALLSIAVGTLQLLLDRGPLKDWFNSGEIKLETAVAALAFYLFVTHTLTAKHPFIRLAIYRDRNFLTGNILIFVVGIVLFATLALLPPLLQGLMGYSVFQAGLTMVPRGAGTLIAMLLVGRAIGRIDVRLIIGVGLVLTAFSLWQMTHLSMQFDMASIIWPGALQGLGIGIVYVPMAALTFATLGPALRNEGTALFNLVRNIGSSIGISTVQGLLVRNTQVVHASLARHITPLTLANHSHGVYAGAQAVAALNRGVTAQASMIAYLDDFQLMLILTVLALPLLLLVRSARAPGAQVKHAALE